MLLMLAWLAVSGCTGSPADSGAAGQAAFTVDPPEAGLGTTVHAVVHADHSAFVYGATSVDFGQGIQVSDVAVADGWNLLADLEVAPDAELGRRDVTLDMDGLTEVLDGAFRVVPQSFTVDPATAMIGETVDVELDGTNTDWLAGRSWAGFGDGIDVLDFTVLSSTQAVATVGVRSDAVPGLRDVYVEDGNQVVTLYDGFQVDRLGLAASFDPDQAAQGDTVEFTVTARGTAFQDGATSLAFLDSGRDNPDVVVDDLTVLDAQNLWGHMTLSNAAKLGMRDVLIQTGTEGVLVPDAFEVVGGEVDLSDVAVSLGFYVTRGIENETGAVNESVTAQAVFVIPLDPPCGSSPMGSGPQPYDANGVFPIPEDSPDDCPYPTTVTAGDHVWLEPNGNPDAPVVTLDRFVDANSGMIYYSGVDLTMADYTPGTWYDLHLEGDPQGLAEEVVERVQPTVPADWQLLSPDLWGNYTQDRTQDFTYTWTPAQTYPDAYFVTSIYGTLESTGEAGFAGCVPWDDGEHTYTPSELLELSAGPVYFSAYSYIQGPEFGLQDSKYQSNQADSYIYLQASMVLE